MKAAEFVKKFGFERAVKVLKSAPVSATSYRVSENNQLGLGGLYGRVENINGCILSLCALKQIVDAWGLVERFGDLRQAKLNLEHMISHNQFEFCATNIDELQKAINLVEQCNA